MHFQRQERQESAGKILKSEVPESLDELVGRLSGFFFMNETETCAVTLQNKKLQSRATGYATLCKVIIIY